MATAYQEAPFPVGRIAGAARPHGVEGFCSMGHFASQGSCFTTPVFPIGVPLGYTPSRNRLPVLTKRLTTVQSARRFPVQNKMPRAITILDGPSTEVIWACFSARGPCIPRRFAKLPKGTLPPQSLMSGMLMLAFFPPAATAFASMPPAPTPERSRLPDAIIPFDGLLVCTGACRTDPSGAATCCSRRRCVEAGLQLPDTWRPGSLSLPSP